MDFSFPTAGFRPTGIKDEINQRFRPALGSLIDACSVVLIFLLERLLGGDDRITIGFIASHHYPSDWIL